MVLPDEVVPETKTPLTSLPEIMLRWPMVVPPIVLPDAPPRIDTPSVVTPSGIVPVSSVPTKFADAVLESEPEKYRLREMFPESTLPAPGVCPPIVLFVELLESKMPSMALPSALVPSVPM